MSDWVDGLPPAAHDRVQRQRRSGTASSLFSAPAAAAARSAGLAPVGEVFGCLVMHLGWSNNGCGWYGQMGGWGAQGMFGGVSPVHSTNSAGISSRNRDGGFQDGAPQDERESARDRYSRFSARVEQETLIYSYVAVTVATRDDAQRADDLVGHRRGDVGAGTCRRRGGSTAEHERDEEQHGDVLDGSLPAGVMHAGTLGPPASRNNRAIAPKAQQISDVGTSVRPRARGTRRDRARRW